MPVFGSHFLYKFYFGYHFVDISLSLIKKEILSRDYSLLPTDAAVTPALHHAHAVADDPDGGWPRFWDYALDRGPAGTSSALALLKLLSLTSFDGSKCHSRTVSDLLSTAQTTVSTLVCAGSEVHGPHLDIYFFSLCIPSIYTVSVHPVTEGNEYYY